jgi:ribosomal protein S18 acetylase RimI-like enzyme
MLDRQDWPNLDAENQAELLAYLGTATCATSHYAAHVTWVITHVDSNDYNGVIWARFSPAEAEYSIPQLVNYFREQGLPALWQLDAASQPPDIGQRLLAAGCRPLLPGVCMVASIPSINFHVPRVAGLTIERVTTLQDLGAWMDVWTHDGEEARAPREQLYANLGFETTKPLHHFIARLDGYPVGVSQLFLGRRAAGLYCVSVLPEFRRHGIGRALTLAPLAVAHARGYDVSVLGPSPAGQPMYQRLGFELVPSAFTGYTLWQE